MHTTKTCAAPYDIHIQCSGRDGDGNGDAALLVAVMVRLSFVHRALFLVETKRFSFSPVINAAN